MAYPVWNSGVPYKTLAGSWSETPALPPIQSEMAGGNTRSRAMPGDDVAQVDFKIAMTRDEYALFRTWFRNTIAKGASRFTMQVWLGDDYYNKVVQFAPQFQMKPAEYGLGVSVPMSLRVYGNA